MKKLLPNQQFRWNTLLPKTAIWSNLHCHPVCSIFPFLQNYHSFLGVFSQSLLYSCPILTLASERPTFEVPLPPPPVWGMWKIPGQGSNLSHSNDNAGSVFLFYGRTCGIWKFPDQGSKSSCSWGLCHSHDNIRSKLHLWPSPQFAATSDPYPTEPQWELTMLDLQFTESPRNSWGFLTT